MEPTGSRFVQLTSSKPPATRTGVERFPRRVTERRAANGIGSHGPEATDWQRQRFGYLGLLGVESGAEGEPFGREISTLENTFDLECQRVRWTCMDHGRAPAIFKFSSSQVQLALLCLVFWR